jgi:2-oxo-4-hydroxy-4-carboxy-5-ureidoimidazoline decarboxylase
MTLAELNALDRDAFVAALAHVAESSPWVAERASGARPFADVAALHAAMVAAIEGAPPERQVALLRAHPELAGRAAIRGALTAASSAEQAGAGLTDCSPDEYAQLQSLNARYNARFGFPFIMAVKGATRAGVIREFERRVGNEPAVERAEGLRQVGRIVGLRLAALVDG